MTTKPFQTLISLLLVAALAAAGFALPAFADSPYETLIEETYLSLKAHKTDGESLLSAPAFLDSAGNTGTDWTAIALSRFRDRTGYRVDEGYDAYADALQKKLDDRLSEGLSASTKYADLYRMILTLKALGRDERDAVQACVADAPVKLTRMNVMTLSYALIAGGEFKGTYAPSDYISVLLSRRHKDGGWTLTAAAPSCDPDVTAAALTALSFYKDDPAAYTVGDRTLTVGDAIDAALSRLSGMQQADGGFISYGLNNCESVSQVIIALTSLGLDPKRDPRFVKNGKTPVDALLSFRLADGAFTHAFDADPENPSASAGRYNAMSTDQALLALVALWRQEEGLTPIYETTDTRLSRFSFAVFKRLWALLMRVLAFFGRAAA